MNSFATAQSLTALPFPRQSFGKPLADDLYSQIFDAILERRLLPGSRFTEDSLGQMFGARRSEIRSVLTRLAHQQIIVLRPHHRPRVAVSDIEQIRQTLHARRLTEIMLVHLASQRPLDLKPLREIIDQQRQCLDFGQRGAVLRLSGEFHLRLAAMAENAPLAHFLGSLVPMTALALAQFDGQIEDYCAWQMHTQMLDALECGDAAKAQALLNRHLDCLEEILLSLKPVQVQHRVTS
ncbi:DNA-binding GntR family transcriptional regulator [Pseudomonas sp. S30_BP2TU TE3576]|uniref:GntR family transcriptional regulator n=1 Tax=Pseudomonas sp. S30_BP2TU TE3576 TaxID=3349329 RepID=UPI003D240CAA